MSKNLTIKIADEFSVYPGARYKTDGDFSGQEFYEKLLKPRFTEVWKDEGSKLEIDFDGTFGYASSFISEVFISMINDFKDYGKIKKKLKLKSDDDPLLITAIDRIMKRADESKD